MKRRLPARGLYAITSDHEQYSRALLASADAALRAGAEIIQYRRKNLPPASAQQEAAALASLCEQYGALDARTGISTTFPRRSGRDC